MELARTTRTPLQKTARSSIGSAMTNLQLYWAECPVEGCGFRKKSFWRNVAKGEVVGHIYRTDGEGNGPRSSHPGRNFKIEVEEVEGE